MVCGKSVKSVKSLPQHTCSMCLPILLDVNELLSLLKFTVFACQVHLWSHQTWWKPREESGQRSVNCDMYKYIYILLSVSLSLSCWFVSFFLSSARRAMEAGMTPVIIDNTNTASWEMKPYVLMVSWERIDTCLDACVALLFMDRMFFLLCSFPTGECIRLQNRNHRAADRVEIFCSRTREV